jgi:cell division protein FtsW
VIRARDTDKLLIVTTFVLLAAGVLMVYSTSYVVAMKRFGDEYFFLKKHLTFAAAGVVCFAIAMKVPYTLYRRLAYPILILSALLLACTYVPGIGFEAGGAHRWIRVAGIAFQPSEPAKLAVVIFLAYSLAAKSEKIKSFSIGFLPNILIPGVIILLILFETDLGTAATLALVVILMNFVAGVRIRYLAGLAGALAAIGYVVIRNFSYMQDRLLVFVDPWADPFGKGFQMVQSFLAFGSGGVTGVGLGEGKQKLFYLPEAHTDFILSVVGEELGLLGVGTVIAMYVLFLLCGMRIAMRAKDLNGKYLATGLTLMLALQAVINMYVVTGLLPPKGLPLPFISYGGTSLLVSMVAVGMLVNIYIKENEA